MSQHATILKIIKQLQADDTTLTANGGIGYCGYGSKLLSLKLNGLQIPHRILLGRVYADTKEGNAALAAAKNIIEAIPLSDDPHNESSNIKRAYLRRNREMLTTTGHIIVLVDDIVYDVTSMQFNNPVSYSIAQFALTWKKVRIAEMELSKGSIFGVNKITTKELYDYTGHNNSFDKPVSASW